MSKCHCGRTTNQPWCDGSHTLTEEQYQARCREDDLENYKKEAQELWFKDGSCTGGASE